MQLATAGRVEKEIAEKGVTEQGVWVGGVVSRFAVSFDLLPGACDSIFFFNSWYFCQSVSYFKREFLLDMENSFGAIYHTLRACKKSTCFFFCQE